MKVLYPYFGFAFLFDHSCGPDWAREVRLKASIMRNYFGGKQPNMRDSVILGGGGFLGPYDRILVTYNTQDMWRDPSLPYILLTVPLWSSYIENK